MVSDTPKTRLASVVLRAALAVIFIWHGLDKVTGARNEWGAGWAEELWRQNAAAPPGLSTKLQDLPPKAWLTEEEVLSSLPDDKIQELRDRRLKEAEGIVGRAYSTSAPDLPGFVSMTAVQYAVAWGELLGGVALLIGLLTRLAALGLIIIQVGAIYFVTGEQGLSPAYGFGYEYNVALMAMCLALLIMGPGGWSVDRYLHWGRTTSTKKPTEGPKPPEPTAVPS